MKIAIAGGTGFVGSRLSQLFTQEGHHVYILTRSPEKHKDSNKITHLGWLKDDFHPEDELGEIDAFINLAGASLSGGRWTEERKRLIMDSRIQAAEEIISIIDSLPHKPEVLINASAVGYYGESNRKSFTEQTESPGTDFLANVAEEWEERASKAEKRGIRTVYLRLGIVLGEAGVLPMMKLPYQWMVGGNLGTGEQWVSWIHVDDVTELINFILQNNDFKGPVNATAPNPKRNKDFGQTLADVLDRPHWLSVPGFALKASLGEMSTLLLNGQAVLPRKAVINGYRFKYPELKPALSSILKKE
ncbi:TIGR01777 family oxidoreductase [Halobacillus salinarum]|uniref:TIGR01777 family oxidoreductase n=2 Tax=Halobacillus salinarum TaxID=2932257 RepID=A0ABY4EPY5_9BACI|nr:TIGR01777 family oxidoreductase [Halobacillus salinarum]